MKIILLFIVYSLFTASSFAGKTRCKTLQEKLQNIQAKQRSGYTAKQGVSLQNRADKVRNKWWRCENSSLYSQHKTKNLIKKEGQTKVKNSNKNKKLLKILKPFATSKAIVVQNPFKGKKQQAWLDFYEKPSKCKRVKSTKVFAFCMEDKSKQQEKFTKQYLQ